MLFQIHFINMSGTNYFCNSVPLFFEMSFIRFAKIVPSLMTGLADSRGMAVKKKKTGKIPGYIEKNYFYQTSTCLCTKHSFIVF